MLEAETGTVFLHQGHLLPAPESGHLDQLLRGHDDEHFVGAERDGILHHDE